MDKDKIISTLEANKDKLKKLGLKKVELFGSYVYDEQTESSDIDFLVEFEEGRGLFEDYTELHHLMKEFFKKNVDIVKKHLLKESLKKHILEGKRIEAKL